MKRNHFNLGYAKKLDMKVGLLYPTYCEDLIAGDIARLGQSEVIRAVNPPTAPITDNFKFHTVYVTIPKRLLDRHYVRNMTGTKTGDVHGKFKVFNPSNYITLTTKNGSGSITSVTNYDLAVNDGLGSRTLSEDDFSNGSLADYFSCDMLQNIGKNDNEINVNRFSAYYMAWNFLFRNSEIEDAVAPIWDIEDNESINKGLQLLHTYEALRDEEGCDFILPRNSPLCEKGLMRVHWRKDYFTDVTLNAQRGTVPTVPINFADPHILGSLFALQNTSSGSALGVTWFNGSSSSTTPSNLVSYDWDQSNAGSTLPTIGDIDWLKSINAELDGGTSAHPVYSVPTSKIPPYIERKSSKNGYAPYSADKLNFNDSFGYNQGLDGMPITYTDLSKTKATFSVTDLRSALVISHFMEMNNTGGFKWSEFLITHFGTCPTDESLERPLLLGTYTDDIFTSEVVQTSADSGSQSLGDMKGHMLGVGSKKHVVNFRAKEPMIVLGLSWISCDRNYESGLNRAWLSSDYLDEYFSVFNGLGAQAVDVQELNAVNTSVGAYNFKTKPKNFAFNERYSHLMSRRNEVCGRLRSGTVQYYDTTTSSFQNISDVKTNYEYYYHNYAIGEGYTIAGDSELVNGTTSSISSEFLAMKPQLTDIFTSSTDVPFVVTVYNRADFFRPIPVHCKTGVQYV